MGLHGGSVSSPSTACRSMYRALQREPVDTTLEPSVGSTGRQEASRSLGEATPDRQGNLDRGRPVKMKRPGTRTGRLCQPPGPRALHGKNRPRGLTAHENGPGCAGAQDPTGRQAGSPGRTPSAGRSIFGRVGTARLVPREVDEAPRFGPASAPSWIEEGRFPARNVVELLVSLAISRKPEAGTAAS